VKKRIIVCILLNIILGYFVYNHIDFALIPVIWVISILFLIIPFNSLKDLRDNAILFYSKVKRNRNELIAVFILCFILVSVVVLNYDSERFHQDDLITAYFSIKHNFSGILFFSPVPLNPTEWVCQFPSLYFAIQQIILGFIGVTNLSVKLSIIPYNLIILIFLYLTLKNIYNKKIAFFGSFFYIFLGISLYFTTLGLHFISSTAIYTVAMYYSVRYFKKPSPKLAVILGICSALSMLFYVSSYLVPFFVSGLILISYFKQTKKKVFRDLTTVILLFFSILLPFMSYCYKENSWYFLQRIDQVKLIDGAWSQNKSETQEGKVDTLGTYLNNLDLSFKSFYTDGIGGQGGYNTSRLAFFDNITAIYALISIVLIIRNYKKNFLSIYFLLTILVTFVAGMVMTIPPPPFHRMTLILPAFAVIFSYPLKLLSEVVKQKYILYGTFVVMIIWFAICNLIHARNSIKTELINSEIPIINYIKDYSPNKHLYIAAYPSLALVKFCLFYDNCYAKELTVETSEEVLLHSYEIKKEDAIIYVLFYSKVKNEFENNFSDYKVVYFDYDQVILIRN
jgi:hypothetical protein